MSAYNGIYCTFAAFNPIVVIIYYMTIMGITMFTMSPFFLILSLSSAFIYDVLVRGNIVIKQDLILITAVTFTMALLNGLFTHNGQTVLFYISSNRITAEAFIYGLFAGVKIASILVWFGSFNKIMTADKIIYLFAKTFPAIGLVITMTIRYVPLLRERYQIISSGQRCMGRKTSRGFIEKIRQTTKELSILIAWSLESSIDTADSMAARGYGLKGRSSFQLFQITARDIAAVAVIITLGIITSIGCIMGYATVVYYPTITGIIPEEKSIFYGIIFTMLMLVPVVIDIVGEIKWKR